MPIDDWQFWIATALALGASWLLMRPFLPRRKNARICGGCPGAPSRARRTPLTVGGAQPRRS